jgi:serine/threonine-protein kinase
MFVLPEDVLFVPIERLPSELRSTFNGEDGDYAVSRPRARTRTKIVDSDAAEILQGFRKPQTILEAVLAYSRSSGLEPEKVLDDAFPILREFLQARLLVRPGSEASLRIAPTFHPGDEIAGFSVDRSIQVVEDTEIYRVRNHHSYAGLKILRPDPPAGIARDLANELSVLTSLDGAVNPALLAHGDFRGRPFLVLEWCDGSHSGGAALGLRRRSDSRKLLEFCCAIVEAYCHLHSQEIIHGDVHPRNLIISGFRDVKVIDFGLARQLGRPAQQQAPRRGGLGFYFEPEYALARRTQRHLPPCTRRGEQYSLAALLYYLITGGHYIEFAVDKADVFRQIEEVNPRAFSPRVPAWPDVERILRRALSKNAGDRYDSLAAFLSDLKAVHVPVRSAERPAEGRSSVASSPAGADLIDDVLHRVGLQGPLLSGKLAMSPRCSINYGASGIAYGLYRLACNRASAELLSMADVWSARSAASIDRENAFYDKRVGITLAKVGSVSLFHSVGGVFFVQALISHALGDSVSQQAAQEAFVRSSRLPCENVDLTLGQCSTLLGCTLLLDIPSHAPLIDPTGVRALGEDMHAAVWDRITTYPSVPSATQLPFLGIAHGWAGVIYASLRWSEVLGMAVPPATESRLYELAACGDESDKGIRWPVRPRAAKGRQEFMSGWCNGSAGQVFLWVMAHRLLSDELFLRLAERAALYSWDTAHELEAIENLCCGLAGCAYALLNLFKHTGDQVWLQRARILARRAVERSLSVSNGGDGLYKGRLGVALLVSDLSDPDLSSMPVFERESSLSKYAHG